MKPMDPSAGGSEQMLFLGMMLLAEVVYSNFCPDATLCECTQNYINCTCLKNERMNIVGADQTFTVKEFAIKGCLVRLKERFLADNDVQSALLSNLQELHVEQYAFQGSKIKDLVFRNIRNFTVENNAFAGIKSISRLTMENVDLEKATDRMFAETTIPVLVIKDSRIGTIDTASFLLKQSDTISIENNTITTINTGSFRIEFTERFVFFYNTVHKTATFSYTFDSVKNVQFRKCRLTEIPPTMILTKNVQAFEFNGNYIRECKEKAFASMHECTFLSFIDNQILMAENNSLIPNEELSEKELQGITSENNEIGCDCGIEWLVATNKPKYADFKEKNTCHYPSNLKGLKLSMLEVEKTKEDGCSALGSFSSAATSTPTVTVASVSETAGKEGNLLLISVSETAGEEGNAIMTTTEAEADNSVKFSEEKLEGGDQAPCDDKDPGNGSPRPYVHSVIVLLLSFVISIN